MITLHRQTARRQCLLLLGVFLLLSQSKAEAQLFGDRQFGGTLNRRAGPGAAAPAGTLRGQRFVRGNRSRRSFVGRSRAAAFVGSQQATTAGSSGTAVSGVGRQGAAAVNQPYQVSADSRPYDPPLAIGFTHPGRSSDEIATSLARRLDRIETPIEVLVEGRVAIVRGEVPSEEQRQMVSLLVGFEPGISVVQNELRLAPATEAHPAPRR